MIKSQLQMLGLNEKEADVYLKLNSIGPSPASTLARLSGIKRTSMYDILNGLMEKGLIMSFKQGHYTYFGIDDVNRLYYLQKEKINLAQAVTRQMLEDRKNLPGIHINYYRGQEGYRQIYDDILLANPVEMMAWIHLDKFYAALDPVREEEWTRERVKRNIKARLLLTETSRHAALPGEDAKSCRETRFIPKEFCFDTTCFLYKDFITLFDSSGDITGIRIQHPQMAMMMKQIFEMNWKMMEKS